MRQFKFQMVFRTRQLPNARRDTLNRNRINKRFAYFLLISLLDTVIVDGIFAITVLSAYCFSYRSLTLFSRSSIINIRIIYENYS